MSDFLRILPELCIALTLVFVLTAEITYYGERLRLIFGIALVGLAGALLQVLISYRDGSATLFYNSVSVDGFSLFFKFLFIVLAIFSISSAGKSAEIPEQRRPEFCALVLASCLAMCLSAGSADLLLTFVALLAVNVQGFLLAGFGKSSLRSTEAGVKFLVFSVVAGGCFLFAAGLLFAETHSLNIYDIHQALIAHPFPRERMLVIFMLFMIALGFQVAAFPLALWAPDVIEGAPTPVSGFLAVGIPASGFAVATRLFLAAFTQAGAVHGQWRVLGDLHWTEILTLLAGITLLFGSLLSLRQTSAKRMVGCLIVAQTGYFLMGLLVLDEIGIAALLYNLLVELFAVVGVFYVLSAFINEFGSDQLSDFKGVLTRAVPESICMVLFLLCIVGIPPMPGFVGKFTLIGVAVRHNLHLLACVAILSMALSTVAISRLAFSLMGDFRSVGSRGRWQNPHGTLFLTSILIPMVLVGVFAQFFLNWAGRSLGFIFW